MPKPNVAELALEIDRLARDALSAQEDWTGPDTPERRHYNRVAIRHAAALARYALDSLAVVRAAEEYLRGATAGHHMHWDNTMQHGTGCEGCKMEREARIKFRNALAALDEKWEVGDG